MWSHNINFYTLPVLAQAMCKSCYPDDLAQPGNPDNSHYWTRLETGRLLLLVLTRPGAQRKRSGGSSEDQQQQPDCRQPSPIMADVGTSHCSPKSYKVIVRKRLRYLDLKRKCWALSRHCWCRLRLRATVLWYQVWSETSGELHWPSCWPPSPHWLGSASWSPSCHAWLLLVELLRLSSSWVTSFTCSFWSASTFIS